MFKTALCTFSTHIKYQLSLFMAIKHPKKKHYLPIRNDFFFRCIERIHNTISHPLVVTIFRDGIASHALTKSSHHRCMVDIFIRI